ncbi:aminoglycoside phosphotransferase family protein [Wukongibacter baidiensis]|uniref:aminoglycoside phosphotransferase family protein n=1 Tax=Wukongibacter baidiensis TaxID=1723361 RepID=UPI003D7F75AF
MKRIGNGRMAVVYKLNDHQALKLFNKKVPMEFIMDEYSICKHVNELGVSSPKVYDIIEKDGQKGILYEFIPGKTYLDILMSNGQVDGNPGAEMANEHLNIHNSKSTVLKDLKDIIKESIRVVDIDEDIKEKLINYLERLPNGDTVCHLDFHPDNLIKNKDNFTVIDWANATKGCKAADVYNTILTISSGTVPPGTPKEVENLINTMRMELSAEYLEHYLQNSDITKEDVYRWKLPILVYRLSHGISEERDDLIRKIKDLASNI